MHRCLWSGIKRSVCIGPPPHSWSELSADPFVMAEREEGFPIQNHNQSDVGRAWNLETAVFKTACNQDTGRAV